MTDDEQRHREILDGERSSIRHASDQNPWIGLCLSGGGIRSASFCIGVLQGLARWEFLEKVDYLSTVSGGSYAGAWLSSWIFREGRDKVFTEIAESAIEPEPVRYLRLHSTYLSEQVGGMDGTVVWSLTYLWNLLLFWCLIVGALGTLLIFPALYVSVLSSGVPMRSYAMAAAVLSALALVFYTVVDHPGFRDETVPLRYFVRIIPASLACFGYASSTLLFVAGGTPSSLRWYLLIAYLCVLMILVAISNPKSLQGSSGTEADLGLLHDVRPLVGLLAYFAGSSALLVTADTIGEIFNRSQIARAAAPPLFSLMLFIVLYLILARLWHSAVELDWLTNFGVFVGVTCSWMLLSTYIVVQWNGLFSVTHCVVIAVITVILGSAVDINQLSLHAPYRHRLVNAYLGASNKLRNPRPLVGLDPADDLPMRELPGRPFLLVNIAARSRDCERSVEPFSISKLFAGSKRLGYRRTEQYSGGLSLGTAIAVSGAAIDPQRSSRSPIVRLFLNVLNARLGVWYPSPATDPRKVSLWRPAQFSTALGPLLHDVLGVSMWSGKNVKLSDGGHFDNLGLFAVVEREPDMIIVIDATEDRDYRCADLGATMQRVRCDLSARIDLNLEYLMRRKNMKDERGPRSDLMAADQRTCAVGKVRYKSGKEAVIIYLKPLINGNEPPEVLSYFASHPSFPQQTTLQQLFDEWQFESYRQLGQHCAESACGEILLSLANLQSALAVKLRAHLQARKRESTEAAAV